MNLLEIRTKLIEHSGRYDLITDTESYADKGANFLISAGQRWLDRTFLIAQVNAKHFADVLQGTWYALIPHARVIERVSLSNSTGAVWSLRKCDYAWMRAQWCTMQPAMRDEGRPSVYSPVTLRTEPEVSGSTTVAKFPTGAYTVAVDNFSFNGILFLPPPDTALQVTVEGKFYTPQLTTDTSSNYWSEEHPWILVLAALRAMEIAQRNREGVADWESAIVSEMLGLQQDYADMQAVGIHHIGQ